MRRRPCRICRRWFSAHPRVGDRQKTCGDPGCQREWHRRKCTEWNRGNEEYFRANYLQKKLDGLADRGNPKVSARAGPRLPRDAVQEVIGAQHLVIIEYLVKVLVRRFQEVIRAKVAVRTG